MIEPTDVVSLLNAADAAATLAGGGRGTVPVDAAMLRELVTVWLRVAAMFEGVEQNPGQHTAEERCAVSILLTGECEHGPGEEHDTAPHHEKPSEPPPRVPTQRCMCGAEWPARMPDFPNLQCPSCGALVQ